MIILSIDTSCDDTSIAVVEAKKAQSKGSFKILSNVVSSQVKLHQEYGGVYPSLAKREHQKNLVPVLKKALKETGILKKSKCQNPNVKSMSNVKCQNLKKILKREPELHKKLEKFFQNYKKPKIDAIAVTVGPGLEPCLWVGINFAKALSFYWNLPIIPVNHIESHILANLLNADITTPAIGLVVSGGHTQLVLMTPNKKAPLSNGARKSWKYDIIGETRDDAAGECFDKTARILGLPYPGGPAIAKQVDSFRHDRDKMNPLKQKIMAADVQLPRPMIHAKDYDFSFSGLKTAVLYDFKKRPKKQRQSQEYVQAMAKEIQQSIIDVLIKKTLVAAKTYKAKTIILGGGVAANRELRKQFQQKIKKEKLGFMFHVSCFKLCTDNAVMIGITAYFHQKDKKPWQKVSANANLRIHNS